MTDLGIVIVNYNTRDDLSHRWPAAHVGAALQSTHAGGRQRLERWQRGPGAACSPMWPRPSRRASTAAMPCQQHRHARPGLAGRLLAESPRYVLLLNPDTVLPPEAVDAVVAYMDAQHDIGARPR